jgi:hypothetical protein
MSKHVRDLLFEFEVQSEVEEHFRLHVLKVTLNENGEAEEYGNACFTSMNTRPTV